MCIWQAGSLQAQTVLMIDNFDAEPTHSGKKYPRYVRTQSGYDIYYERADVILSLVESGAPRSKALRIEFALPPAFPWGNWLSVRREFESPMNLEAYKGLELHLRVDVPSPDAFLRITLADLTDDMRGGDEMWWCDSDKSLLKRRALEWVKIRIAFSRCVLSSGEGTRQNDYRMNLKKIIAYEVNVISKHGTHPNGVLLLDSLHAYK
jgi:hypothetical protein